MKKSKPKRESLMKRLLKIAKVYCESCWIPAVVHVVTLWGVLAATFNFNEMLKELPREMWPIIQCPIYVSVVGTWAIMPLAVIINLCKRRWWRSVISLLFGVLGTIPIVLLVMISRSLASCH